MMTLALDQGQWFDPQDLLGLERCQSVHNHGLYIIIIKFYSIITYIILHVHRFNRFALID